MGARLVLKFRGRRRSYLGQDALDVVATADTSRRVTQQGRQFFTLVHEDAKIAVGLPQLQRAVQRLERVSGVVIGLVSQRGQDQDLDAFAVSAGRNCLLVDALENPQCEVGPTPVDQ